MYPLWEVLGTVSLLSLVGEISFLCPRGKQFPELVLKRARAILKQLCWASLLSSESHQCFAGEISHASTVHQPWAQIVFKIFTCCYNTWVRIPSFLFFFFFCTMWLARSSFPNQRWNPMPLAVRGPIPNHWATRTSWGLL